MRLPLHTSINGPSWWFGQIIGSNRIPLNQTADNSPAECPTHCTERIIALANRGNLAALGMELSGRPGPRHR